MKDANGKTALDLARTNENEVMVKLVLRMMDFLLKMMDFLLKMMESAPKMMDFALNMTESAGEATHPKARHILGTF